VIITVLLVAKNTLATSREGEDITLAQDRPGDDNAKY